MSILIKGLDMPKNCDDCIWIQRGYPDWCDLPMGKDIYNDGIRQEWCPLVEVKTPHGRLIDADELLECYTDIEGAFDPEFWNRLQISIGVIRQNIDDIPAIIEAEE